MLFDIKCMEIKLSSRWAWCRPCLESYRMHNNHVHISESYILLSFIRVKTYHSNFSEVDISQIEIEHSKSDVSIHHHEPCDKQGEEAPNKGLVRVSVLVEVQIYFKSKRILILYCRVYRRQHGRYLPLHINKLIITQLIIIQIKILQLSPQ